MPVYSKTLTLNKGVDNTVQFQFLNSQQKTVDITNMYLTFRILSQDASKILLSKALSMTLPLTGIASLEISAAELEDIVAQRCYYSIEYTKDSGVTNYAAYMDALAGARGDLVIADSVFPKFMPSMSVTIPSDQLFPNNAMYSSQCSIIGLQSQALTYYSSSINTSDNPVLTFQVKFINYQGNVVVEGAVTNDDTSWYPIAEYAYTNLTDTIGYTIHGYHPNVRLKFVSWAGIVQDILVR